VSALATIRAAGLTVQADGGRLLVSPSDRLRDDLPALIREHKADILGELRDRVAGALAPAVPGAPDLEQRRASVANRLRSDPTLRYAFDVIDIPPAGLPAKPVSIMLGLRDREGRIVTGELMVPADKWDMPAFLAYWDAQGRPS
jgi:hypothetical protein